MSGKPLGNGKPEFIAEIACEELNYLCIDEEELEEFPSMVLTELAILETYKLLSEAESEEDSSRIVVECLTDDDCFYQLLSHVNEVVDIYYDTMGKYFFNMSLEDLRKAVSIAENASRIMEAAGQGERSKNIYIGATGA